MESRLWRTAQKALALSGKTLDSRVYVMLGAVADRLAIDGHYLASRALTALQAALDPEQVPADRVAEGIE